MDVTLNNVLEGARQYFLGLPKQAQGESGAQPGWPAGVTPPEEGAPAQSGAPAPKSRPPSAAAEPPTTPVPQRPPSEPLEPEPHIIHKATVMREALEKRRELPDPDEEHEDANEALSPPSHFIRKPPAALPSPAPAPAAPCPSPARPPSSAPEASTEQSLYRPSPHHRGHAPTSRPPDPYAVGRPPDPYSASRPPESYARYHYETSLPDGGRTNRSVPSVSPQPSAQPRQSPQTYARLSSSVPMHPTSRIREQATQSPPTRYPVVPLPTPPHNDRVPPIHHPTASGHQSQSYPPTHHGREPSPYSRAPVQYDRNPTAVPRKYDHQHAYPGYRPTQSPQHTHRLEPHTVQYKQPNLEHHNLHYVVRPQERVVGSSHMHDTARLPSRAESSGASRADSRPGQYPYLNPSASSGKYAATAPVPVVQSSSIPPRSAYRQPPLVTKQTYDYGPPASQVPTSPIRPTVKPNINTTQQNRMTVSVTSLVNQMNQTKHKRESPLDLSVKTVKNSADSSTTQDDAIDSATAVEKPIPLQHRPSSSTRPSVTPATHNYVTSHKVDFAPDFNSQYRDQGHNSYPSTIPPVHHPPVRYNGALDSSVGPHRSIDSYPHESRHAYYERPKYVSSVPPKSDPVPRIDLTKTPSDRHHDGRIRDDRNFIIEERKRPSAPMVANIPEKMMRYETWTADSRIDRVNKVDQSAQREQHELMSRPVYSCSHKRLETYHNEKKRQVPATTYRDPHLHMNNRYGHSAESLHYPSHHRNVIQKHPNYRDPHHHHYHHHHPLEHHNGIPADKKVLSILRNSLETRQINFSESPRQVNTIPDLIVIDDNEDDITDLTKENDSENTKAHSAVSPGFNHVIQMPKAVDSIANDSDFSSVDKADVKSKSPENDVAARIRTKAELKVMPPPQEACPVNKHEPEITRVQPKSQKQHLFNQIREDNLRLESVIKSEITTNDDVTQVKTEPMNIEEIEKDAEVQIKAECKTDDFNAIDLNESVEPAEVDLDWATACSSFMEQLKTGCHKKRGKRKITEAEIEIKHERKDLDLLPEDNPISSTPTSIEPQISQPLLPDLPLDPPPVIIKQEPIDDDEISNHNVMAETPVPPAENVVKVKNNIKKEITEKTPKSKVIKTKETRKSKPDNVKLVTKTKRNLVDKKLKKKVKEKKSKPVIKEEPDSTDDDEPLIKSKLLKEKEKSDQMKFQLLKDLSEKSVYVKLECCDVSMKKSERKSLDSSLLNKEKESKNKSKKQTLKTKGKSLSLENDKTNKNKLENVSSDSDGDIVATRLRVRKNTKSEDSKPATVNKTPVKSSPTKKQDVTPPLRRSGFGDGSDFHPGWEEDLYKYKRSLRMPTRLIAIPRGRSGGPFPRCKGTLFSRGSTSLPDLDPAPLSPAPSSVLSAATDDLYTRRQDKIILDSDMDSNSSCSVPAKLNYDSEASTSTIFSTRMKKKGSSIVDILMQKCAKMDDIPKKKGKDIKNKEDKTSSPKNNLKKADKVESSASLDVSKKEKKGPSKKDRSSKETSEELSKEAKSKIKKEDKVLKPKASLKEVFGDDRPSSAPPLSSKSEDTEKEEPKDDDKKKVTDMKAKLKSHKLSKDKLKRRSSSIRDGLRSTKFLKSNDAKGRLLRLKKRNNLILSLAKRRMKDMPNARVKKEHTTEDKEKQSQEESTSVPLNQVNNKRKFKRIFGRRKFSSGFDYIRKKKKIIRREEGAVRQIRRPAKPNLESVHDIHKEIKGWFINKSIGETHLHRAARLGYTDCVAYCLEKMEADPSAKDNAGFTPLHVAAAKGHVRIGRLLLQYGANVSAAAQGGIRPLHEAAENDNVEMIRLLLSYGADPVLGTYAGQTPLELAEETMTATLLRLHIDDIQGKAVEPWYFPPLTQIIDPEDLGCHPLASPPPGTPPPPEVTTEILCTEVPLPPFYSLRAAPGQPAEGFWCLLQDITSILQIKSKESLLKQIHCGSGSPKELFREIRTQEFLERAQCHQLMCAGEKLNVRASKVSLVRVTDKLRQLLKIETVLIS